MSEDTKIKTEAEYYVKRFKEFPVTMIGGKEIKFAKNYIKQLEQKVAEVNRNYMIATDNSINLNILYELQGFINFINVNVHEPFIPKVQLISLIENRINKIKDTLKKEVSNESML